MCISGWWFQPTHLKNMSSSVGIMKFPINMESQSKFHGSKLPTSNHYTYTVRYSQYMENITCSKPLTSHPSVKD